MSPSFSVAANLSSDIRKDIALKMLSKTERVSHLAKQHQVSRKFVYQQGNKAQQAIDESFAPTQKDTEVLFYLPVTQTWLFQLILALVLICHSSYRGVVELFRDLFDISVSIGTIHNRLKVASEKATEINQAQDLSGIKVGLHDEIYQGSQPVLTGVDAASTYCYLLEGVETRDEDTWGWYLLDTQAQGFNPDYIIADGGQALRAGQRAVMPDIPCHGDVFHIQHEFETIANTLKRQAQGATNRRIMLEQRIARARGINQVTRSQNALLVQAKKREKLLVPLAKDIKTLLSWMSHDILKLAGPPLKVRLELFDFIVCELEKREHKAFPKIRTLRKTLSNHRDNLLAFAGVLDQKLLEIAQSFELPIEQVRKVCLLHRKQPTSNAYWERWNQLHHEISVKFYGLMNAVTEALEQTPRASSLVENLNSRLRNYFFLRRTLSGSYLELLQFFLNHRRFMRSDVPERVGKSPKELLVGKIQPHWLEVLGFRRFQRA